MNILQTALEAIELLTTDNNSEAAQAAAADARIKLMNAVAMEPVAWITTHEHSLLCYTKAEADTFCSNDESSIPLYLHPPQQVAVPEGYVQLPIEPTPEMLQAMSSGIKRSLHGAYKAMLAAAQGEKP